MPDPVQREYARLARIYDMRWHTYVQASVRETLRSMHIRPGQSMLDIGCGTGVLLKALADASPGTVLTGIDATREMLATARQRLPACVRLHQARAEQLPFGEASFDAVISCNMFHYIRQPQTALQEMRRVLKPAGMLIITDWCNDHLTCRLCDAFLRLTNRAHHRAYRMRECRDMLAAAGFSGIAVERYKIDWFWGMMTATAVRPPG